MKELVTIAASFVIVVALALYMYIGNKEHSIAVSQEKEIAVKVEQNREDLQRQIDQLKSHIDSTDEIYHNRKTE